MRKTFQPLVSKTMLAAATLAIAGGSICTYVVRAQDLKSDMKMGESKMGDMKMGQGKMTVSPEESKMMMDRIDKMKEMAADPAQAETMKTDMAKMMVMDHMAHAMASDPKIKQACMDMMNDANVKKVHEEAMKMAMDPEQMKKIQEEIAADPNAMKHVDHAAMMMSMHDNMGAGMGGGMHEKMMGKMSETK